MEKDLVIVGSGAAGLAAGIYAAGRYGLNTLIIGEKDGGTTVIAGKVENYPGVLPIEGWKLAETMIQQTKAAGAEMAADRIIKISKSGTFFELQGAKGNYRAKAVIYAAGNEWRKLGIPNEKELTGKGVHYCAICDGPLYKGKKVAIAGGGNSSVKAANLIAGYAEKVFLITIDKQVSAEPANFEKLKAFGEKIEIITETKIKEIKGETKLEHLILEGNFSGKLEADGLFIEIGSEPNIDSIKELKVALNDANYIKTGNMAETNVPGFFAAGDVSDHFGRFKQIIVAAAMGSVAAASAYEFLKSRS